MNSRRQILKLLGMAPATVTSAVPQLAALMSSPAVAAAGALIGGGVGTDPPPSNRLGSVLGAQIHRLRNRAEAEKWIWNNTRFFGLDPDIDALRSLSRVNKVRRQRERDIEGDDILQRVQEAMWG